MAFYQRLTLSTLALSSALFLLLTIDSQAFAQAPETPKKAGSADSGGQEKTLPFPLVSSDNVQSLTAVHHVPGKKFPSAIDIKGTSKGLLLHARKETRYDLLSSVALWLESGPLLVSVRAPTQTALIASRFGDVCITTGGDALIERGEGWLRIDNLGGVGAGGDSVCLVMHDKQWKNSPWSHLVTVKDMTSGKKNKKKTESTSIETGIIAVSPGYELLVGDHALEVAEVKPPDTIGRRDFKIIEGGRFVVSEVNVDNLVAVHDLVKNLKEHGEKAESVLSEINKVAAQFKTRQGDEGFEKVFPPPPKPPETVKKPDKKPKTPVTNNPKTTKPPEKPKAPQQAGTDTTPPGPAPAPGGKSQTPGPGNPVVNNPTSTPAPSK